MNQNQELKLQLLKQFGISDELKTVDFCREAYKFLIEGDAMMLKGVNAVTGEVIVERVPLTPTHSKVVAVDLGLPSGTKWCDRNVGAKSPEDYGAYFSWGNIEPHYPKENCEHEWGDCENAFDYTFDEDEYNETKGGKITEKDLVDDCLPSERDAATQNMGAEWEMPTEEQFKELYDNCTWTRKVRNGVNGYVVKSRINGAEIYFPCSGGGSGTSWNLRGSYGFCWSASLYSATHGRSLYFYSGSVNPQDYNYRFYGFAVRPVQNIVLPK
jgi:hypothetical protein